MIDERAYELLCCQLGLANEEKAGLRKQVNELIARLKAIEESNRENSKALVDTINDLKDSLEKQSTMVEHYRKEMELMRKQLEAKDEVNMMLANEISNLRLQLEDGRKHRFGRTSEQRRLLDNRNIDKSAMEKSEYDGSGKKGDDDNKTDGNVTGSNTSSGNVPVQDCRPSRKKETAPRAAKTRLKVDKVIVHEIEDYLWAFFAKHVKLVYYHYNNGSRASDVAKTFLEHFMGSVSTDGYTVYRMFDGEDSKVLHIGCWTHCRRLWVDALPSDRTAMDIIDPIGDMFRNEDLFRTMKLSGEQIKEKRLKLTRPILERIHHKVVMMMQDTKLMANELMRKAVNYTINQWKSLKNILKDGAAEISNNLCEQRMKPVKLLLKNCMNIGSEDAAGNSAFIFSLIESCKLNDIDPQDYLKHLFECILHDKDCDKKALLPCFYKSEC